MNTADNFANRKTTSEHSCRIYTPDGLSSESSITLVHEHIVEIDVNCIPAVRLSCTPEHLPELIAGRLYTEGIIDSIDEVERLFICGTGETADITLNKKIEPASHAETEPTCCTGNKQLLISADKREMRKLPSKEPDREAVFALAERFRKDTMLHSITGSTHSCYLYAPGGEISEFEDISRHNALDKAVGYALMNGIDITDCMLYTTGRIPEDMVRKAVMAGVPVLISKAMPTDTAVEMAGAYGLTLICSAWPDSFKIII